MIRADYDLASVDALLDLSWIGQYSSCLAWQILICVKVLGHIDQSQQCDIAGLFNQSEPHREGSRSATHEGEGHNIVVDCKILP